SSATVVLKNNPGGATLGGTTSATASTGVANFAGLTLNKVGSGYTFQVISSALLSVTTGASDVVAAAASQLVVMTQPPATITAGKPFGLAVVTVDDFGNVVPTFNGSISVALVNNPGGATLSGTTTVTGSGGASFSGLSLDKAASGY